MRPFKRLSRLLPSVVVSACLATSSAYALDDIQFNVAGDDGLKAELEAASLLLSVQEEGVDDPRDLLATSLAEYQRLLNTLYANGHYGGVINVRLDGVEAAAIQNFNVPSTVRQITVDVRPGQQFHFGRTEITPLVQGTQKIEAFRNGEPARSTVIQDAVDEAIDDWRYAGRAKATVRDQDLTANHANNLINARIWIDPGPLVRFGQLRQVNASAVRSERIRRIAGLPEGEVFDPDEADEAANRLRRTGAFASVVLREADDLGPGNTMDMLLTTADMKPRRFGFGAELSSIEGFGLSAYWMHRNLLGGAERLRIDGAVNGITPAFNNIDIELDARLDVPAAFGTDNDAYVEAGALWLHEPSYNVMGAGLEAGVKRYFTPNLEGEIGLGYAYARVTDSFGTRSFSTVKVPAMVEWDRRDDSLNPTRGFYVRADVEPFYDFGRGAGIWGQLDARVYRGFGEGDRFVLAARGQVGTVVGPNPAQTHPDLLFYSGGGGTVRGQPYQSLNFPSGTGTIGGQAFVGGQFEVRVKATDTIGVVGFFDVGYLGETGFTGGMTQWHSGAGLGLRYNTALGPIRLDVAYPVTGGTRAPNPLRNVQLYVGIGHAF
ncbi:MAG: BamA/TamA family outer membrane protein [Pseudomonadota bacterium]|nr:BamA/TamA family outer membrane protein [Pseudomonadota bacterium]